MSGRSAPQRDARVAQAADAANQWARLQAPRALLHTAQVRPVRATARPRSIVIQLPSNRGIRAIRTPDTPKGGVSGPSGPLHGFARPLTDRTEFSVRSGPVCPVL